MINNLRLYYLQSMGITAWQLRPVMAENPLDLYGYYLPKSSSALLAPGHLTVAEQELLTKILQNCHDQYQRFPIAQLPQPLRQVISLGPLSCEEIMTPIQQAPTLKQMLQDRSAKAELWSLLKKVLSE